MAFPTAPRSSDQAADYIEERLNGDAQSRLRKARFEQYRDAMESHTPKWRGSGSVTYPSKPTLERVDIKYPDYSLGRPSWLEPVSIEAPKPTWVTVSGSSLAPPKSPATLPEPGPHPVLGGSLHGKSIAFSGDLFNQFVRHTGVAKFVSPSPTYLPSEMPHYEVERYEFVPEEGTYYLVVEFPT